MTSLLPVIWAILGPPRQPQSHVASDNEVAESQLAQLAKLPGLRVVIPTGAGRVFSAGGLVEFEQALNTGKQTLLFDTAGLVDAQTLKDWGLINEVVPRERLMDRAMEIARDISLCSP